MKKLGFILLLLIFSSCGYNGSYRYSCQDPDNWGTKECAPPLCSADGNCTETLLGFDPTASTIEIIPKIVEGIVAP